MPPNRDTRNLDQAKFIFKFNILEDF